MMSKKIIHSDAFLDMPATSQNLYFHLLLEADDEGFVNSPKRIQRTVGASDGDAQMLIAKKFIISFESGVIVIKHWRIHNYIQNDRFKFSAHTKERSMLSVNSNNSYSINDVSSLDTNCTPSIGEDRLGEDSIDKSKKKAAVTIRDSFVDMSIIQSFIDHRKSIKKPMTQKAVDLFIAKIESLAREGQNPQELIEAAIMNGWQSVYPQKQTRQDKRHVGHNQHQQLNQIGYDNVFDAYEEMQ